MELKVTRTMVSVHGREVPVYTGSMKHKQLFEHTKAYTFNLEADDLSYQRKIDTRNLKNIVAAYTKGDPVFGSILVNARPYVGESVLKWRSGDGTFGIVEIPNEPILSIMDGQHRIASYPFLPDSRLDFPVVIYDGLSVLEENQAFLALNFKAKKLTKSHGQVISLQVNQSPSNKEQTAAYIAMKISRRPDSPWFNRLATDSAQVVKKVSKQKKREQTKYIQTFSGMADSISRHMLGQETTFYDLSMERKVDVLVAYWRAINALLPDCWNDPVGYRLTSGLGPSVMHKLLVQHFAKKVDLEVADEGDFQSVLAPLVDLGGAEFWAVMGPLRGLSGRLGVQQVVDALRKAMDTGRLETFVSLVSSPRASEAD